jgi:23S rRNA (pseudouridine1915-N3)-methyltransferase
MNQLNKIGKNFSRVSTLSKRVVSLLSPIKNKDSQFEAIIDHYKKRIVSPSVQLHEFKTGMKLDLFLKDQLKESNAYLVLLDASGKKFQNSETFSKWFFKLMETERRNFFFVFGGAFGHEPQVKEKADEMISLSPLTFPHQLSRVILLEQLFRAQEIYYGRPYNY